MSSISHPSPILWSPWNVLIQAAAIPRGLWGGALLVQQRLLQAAVNGSAGLSVCPRSSNGDPACALLAAGKSQSSFHIIGLCIPHPDSILPSFTGNWISKMDRPGGPWNLPQALERWELIGGTSPFPFSFPVQRCCLQCQAGFVL